MMIFIKIIVIKNKILLQIFKKQNNFKNLIKELKIKMLQQIIFQIKKYHKKKRFISINNELFKIL